MHSHILTERSILVVLLVVLVVVLAVLVVLVVLVVLLLSLFLFLFLFLFLLLLFLLLFLLLLFCFFFFFFFSLFVFSRLRLKLLTSGRLTCCYLIVEACSIPRTLLLLFLFCFKLAAGVLWGAELEDVSSHARAGNGLPLAVWLSSCLVVFRFSQRFFFFFFDFFLLFFADALSNVRNHFPSWWCVSVATNGPRGVAFRRRRRSHDD